MNSIKTIIFDLGQVILNVDWHKTTHAFQELGLENTKSAFDQLHQSGFFQELQTGYAAPEDFIKFLRGFLPAGVSNKQIIKAWNAMLMDFPPERLHLIHQLSRRYTTFLLSNTNRIHWQEYYPRYQEILRKEGLPPLFKKEYYSHELGLAKPDVAIYKRVLQENRLEPESTLFLDDKEENLEAARLLNIQVQQVTPENDIIKIFEKTNV